VTDVQIQRSILQYAYDHRHDHPTQVVDVKQLQPIACTDENRLRHNIILLRDLGYVKPMNTTLMRIRITTLGIRLVENTLEFNERFPIRLDIPEQTKVLTDTVEQLLSGTYDAPLDQYRKAKRFLYDTNPPDFPNCIKESVGALEALSKILVNETGKDLGRLIPQLREKYLGHPALGKIIDAIYAIRGDEPGVAHGAYDMSRLSHEDAELILNISSSLIIYLIGRSTR
jgi:hypothetical protein